MGFCPECHKPHVLSAKASSQSVDFHSILEDVKHYDPDTYQEFRLIAEVTETPLVILLEEALITILPQLAKEYRLCPKCLQPLNDDGQEIEPH